MLRKGCAIMNLGVTLSSLLLIFYDTDAFVWGWDCPAICMYIKSKPLQVVDLQQFCLNIGGERGF